MGHVPIRSTNLYGRLAKLEDEVWREVVRWGEFERRTVGAQLVRAMDSIGANLCEGDGRYGGQDAVRFFTIARGSGSESVHWIERATARKLVNDDLANRWKSELDELMKMLNGLIAHRRSLMVKEKGTACDEP